MDDWLEFSVRTDREAAEAVSEVFNRLGSGGAVIEQEFPEPREKVSADVPLTVKTFVPADDAAARQALVQALQSLSLIRHLDEPRIRLLRKEEWAEAWKHHFHVQHIGDRIVVVPSWLEYAPQAEETVIHLDPGLAFGTGLHPSTRLSLRAMERVLTPGARVLDVGTGSGILSIAAAKMGSPHVWALDTDPMAVKVARENVRLNGVADRVYVTQGSIGTGPAGVPLLSRADAGPPEGTLRADGYDLTVANIIAEVIIELAKSLAASVALGGHLIASGIIRDREDAVATSLSAAGLRIANKLEEGDWIALLLDRDRTRDRSPLPPTPTVPIKHGPAGKGMIPAGTHSSRGRQTHAQILRTPRVVPTRRRDHHGDTGTSRAERAAAASGRAHPAARQLGLEL